MFPWRLFLFNQVNDILFDFLSPFIEEEKEHLKTEYGLCDDAAASGAGLLEGRLINLTAPVVLPVFLKELEKIAPPLIPGIDLSDNEQKMEAAQKAKELIREIDIFHKYVDLCEYRQIICDNFRRFIHTFLSRVELSAADIAALPGSGDLKSVRGFSASGADCHLHGSCALRVDTEGGSFYYKPRDTRPDMLFGRIAMEFFPKLIKAPYLVAPNNDYGFIEEVRYHGVETKEDINRFYYNFGVLLALFRSLGSNDMHYENLIASGTFPVCVDCETLVTPLYKPFYGTDYTDMSQMSELWKDSFFSTSGTMVLPTLLQGKVQMSPLLKKGIKCLPLFEGREMTIHGHEEPFKEGFENGYDIVFGNRDKISRLLDEYSDMSTRFVFRASSYYAITLEQFHSHEYLLDRTKRDKEYSLLIDRLSDLDPKDRKAIVDCEWESLLEGDIPFLSVSAGKLNIYEGMNGKCLVRDFFDYSAIDHAKMCLAHMGPKEKRYELDYLNIRLLQAPELKEEIMTRSPAKKNEDFTDASELSGESATEEAMHLFEKMMDLKITSSAGDVLLLSRGKDRVPERVPGLARGMQGIAMFLEELDKAYPDNAKVSDMKDICKKDSNDLVRIYKHFDREKPDKVNIGLNGGIGGILYSKMLSDDDAEQFIRYVSQMDFSRYPEINVANGSAGLAIGVYSYVDNKDLRESCCSILSRIRDRLLDAGIDVMPPGLLGGKSGVAYALTLCGRVFKSEETGKNCNRLADKIFGSVYEQYNERLNAWTDDIGVYSRDYMCLDIAGGAPGTGLAALLSVEDIPSAGKVFDVAMKSVFHHGMLEEDDLVSGNAGVVAFLLEAYKKTGRKEYLKRAGNMLLCMTKRLKRNGDYNLCGSKYVNVPDPSLFDGYAGIGYVLLQYADMIKGR